MGHYEHLKFECPLSETGLEILREAHREQSWLETAKVFPQFPFLEVAATRIANHGRGDDNQKAFLWFDLGELEKTKIWICDVEDKIDDRRTELAQFLVPYFARDLVYWYYWNEHFDSCDRPYPARKADELYLEPQELR